jgi:hypothetical protein
MIKVRRPARTILQLLNAREKVFRPQGIFLFPEKVPSPACRFRVAEEVAGFCIFNLIWSAPAERSGDGALDC